MSHRADAIQMYNRATALAHNKGVVKDAQVSYQLYCSSAIVDPTFANGWYQVGCENSNLGLHAAAVGCFRRCVELPDGTEVGDLNPAHRVRALVNLAHHLYHIGRIDESRTYVEEALTLGTSLRGTDLNLGAAWLNLSLVQAAVGENLEAINSARKAFALDQSPVVEMSLAFALLFNGDYAEGLKHYEARFPYKLPQFLAYPYPQWQGEADATVWLVSEQGMGDALSFSRFVEAAAKRSRFLHIQVQPELVRLFTAAFQRLTNINITASPGPWPPADYWTTFMSLPNALGLTTEEIRDAPPIEVPPFSKQMANWKSTDRKLHIGIAWAGSPASDINRWRSIDVTQFLQLYQVPGIQLYSLQADAQNKALHDAGCATLIRDLAPGIRDVTDTISILKELDMVITCESALGHIAGLCGVETWVAYSYHGRDWRLGWDGSSPLWYKKHRAFKQGPEGLWQPVFDRIVEALRERVA